MSCRTRSGMSPPRSPACSSPASSPTHRRRRWSSIYFLRAAIVGLFLLFPVTPLSVYLFAASIGFLWLGTVPLTNGLVGQIFGVRYVSTLFGIVFFSHQVGSFMGVWLGGYLFDATGSYNVVWVASIGLAILAGIINLPIDERPIERLSAEAA